MLSFLPLGSYEQHGNLPWDLDTKIALRVAEELAKRLGGEVLPPLPYSCSWEWERSVSLRVETLAMVLSDINSSLVKMGKRLVVVNAHGGNSGLVQAIGRQEGFYVVDFWRACGIKVGHCDGVEVAVAKRLGIDVPETPFEEGWPEGKVSAPRIPEGCWGWKGDPDPYPCIEAIAEELGSLLSERGA